MSADDAECVSRWFIAADRGELDAGAECIVAELRRLRAENERLRGALKPFADEARSRHWMSISSPVDVMNIGGSGLTNGDLRRAAELLAATEPPTPSEGT